MITSRRSIFLALSLLAIVNATSATPTERVTIGLSLNDQGFVPNKLTIRPGQKILIQMTNNTKKAAELESFDMKFEKIALPGSVITVFAGPLRPGTYTFFDDYSPSGVKGTLQAVEGSS